MKRVGVLVLAAAAVAAACDDNDTTGPSNAPIVFTAQLSAANEVPPISNAESGARGAATVTVHVTRDANNAITSGTVDFNFQLTNFPQGSSATLAHIHTGAAGVAGPVYVNTGLTPQTAVPIGANGTATFNATGLPITVDQINAILANPGGYYFNVHSPLNPGGVVRGQLARIQ